MIILISLIGAIAGWLLNWVADHLPRFSSSRPAAPLLRQGHDLWFRAGAVLLSAGCFAFFWAQFGASWRLLFYAGVFAFFLLIAIIDLKCRLVLNILTYPATVIILLAQWILLRQNLTGVVLGGGLALAIFSLAAWLGDLGGGDIKLATLIGVAFGFPQMLWALIVGGGFGAVVAVILILRHRRASIPYAPFLCLGAMVALLYNPITLSI